MSSRATTVDAASLFPYSDGVGVYAGDCPANDPSLYDSDYFVPPTTRGWVALNPGDLLKAVSVEMPTLRVTVNRQAISGTVPSWTRTQLMVTQADTGCTDVIHTLTDTKGTANQTAVQFNIAQPFGHYTLCASTRGRTSGTSGTTGQTTVDRKITASINMTNVPATKDRATTMTTTATTSGVCF